MNQFKRISALFISLLMTTYSCGNKSDFAIYEGVHPIIVDKNIYPLSLLEIDKNIDILFVIDNSPSMAPIQNNVIKNAKIFMNQFIRQPYINWKIGLISTDENDPPYLGFETPFDASLINFNDPSSFNKVVETFQEAVKKLDTTGSGRELVFYNLKKKINQHPSFLRTNSHLVVVMITDEPEQSELHYGDQFEALNFYNSILLNVPSNRVLRFYGAFDFKDLIDCEGQTIYKGSPFEVVVKLSNGFSISACTSEFGVDLAKIGTDIAGLVGQSSLLLKERPRPQTIKVYYKNKELKSGPKEQGGVWYYEHSSNTINFYNINFVEDPAKDFFKIDFTVHD